ncbi:CDP-diacylglycerol--serine O-phosphatidyltransferase [hydrothermal vent metagenome]|uniref:CDP-diacylglycerol--serine O-phosphatidyltransferase n=1 Tax=hydrothermal vent metagenome TaxID=652676 RepID=A0A1W1CEN7_9ZZZZ
MRSILTSLNSLILVAIFLLHGVVSHEMFTIILYISGVGLAILNVSEIKTPKLSGNPRNVYLLAAYTLGMTLWYGMQV